MDRLIDDWESGRNRFSEPGEKLHGVFAGGGLVAVGGLNRDPYVQRENVGRLRHIYVHPRCRRLGIGKLVVAALLKGLSRQFWKVCLRQTPPQQACFMKRAAFAVPTSRRRRMKGAWCRELVTEGRHLARSRPDGS